MESDSSYDSSGLLEASPDKSLSATIWSESRIGAQCKSLGNNSKESEESTGEDKLHPASKKSASSVHFNRYEYRDKQASESESDEEKDFIKHGEIKSNGIQSESDEEEVVVKCKVVKGAPRNRLVSDSDSEQNVSDKDTKSKWRKKPVIQSDSESDNYHSASNAGSDDEDTIQASPYASRPIVEAANKVCETPSSKENSSPEGEQGNQSVSSDRSSQILELSDSGTQPKLISSTRKKRTSKGNSHKSDGSQYTSPHKMPETASPQEYDKHVSEEVDGSGGIVDLSDSDNEAELNSSVSNKRISQSNDHVASGSIDSSTDCICLDDTPVQKRSLDRLKKRSNEKMPTPDRSDSKQMVQGKDLAANLSAVIDKMKAASLTAGSQQRPQSNEKTTQQQSAIHNEHEMPVFVLGKKFEKVTLKGKDDSDLSPYQKKKELEMKITSATQNVARLKKTLMNTNLNVLPDRGERLRTNLAEEERKTKMLNEEYQTLLREHPSEKMEKKQVVQNPFQTVGNAAAQRPADPDGNRQMVLNSFQAAISAASQQPVNAENKKKPLSYLGSMPTTIGMGQKALERFRAEKSMTVDTLKLLHKSMETCPGEDTLEEDPKHLKSNITLMPHQKRALAWLLWREAHKPHGGILADDMGLGKTLTMISLVLKVRELAETKAQDENERESDSEDEHENSWYSSKRKLEKGGTLVVCPASLINQWEGEVKSKCKKGVLSVQVFHGTSRESKPRRLARHDMVITTYNIVRSEGGVTAGKRGAGDTYDYSRQGPLFGVKWERIILDEAHQIRNHKSLTSIAACGLTGKYRWALTGTPMHNKDLDLYALLKFLRCTPFDDLSVWRQWIGNKSAGGMQRLNTVINSLMLRRTKEQLHSKGALGSLSEKHMHQITVKLDKEEFEVYETVLSLSRSIFQMFLEQRAEKAMQQWEKNKPVNAVHQPDNPYELNDELKALHQKMMSMKNIKTFEILVLLLRLRQICCLPGLIKAMLDEESCKNDTIEDEDGVDIDLMSKLSTLGLDDKENENSETLNADNAVKRKVLVADNPVFDTARISSKMKTLFKILHEKILPTGDNVVIVSQWSTLLDIMKGHLQREGVKCLMLTGAVAVKDRMAIVDAFNAPSKNSTVLLLSLTAGGVGLNLVGGNHLLLFDIHWNPQLEAQAFDRIYRVGQTKTVHIYKFICDDTIEQRILALQNKKLQIADSILTGVRQKQASKLTLDDLKMLFNLHAN